uniref:Tail sheath protein n=2 Tax=unclassified Caudoviricetes TaxID=2788787 RepID=A0A8S5PU32_9CAUD|nr:MAG TPA: tail sheath protein [Siphoviridae sp. ctL1i33]DAE12070.1 MAG TPA: tail sheath protein [Siphoviridae sp. ctwIe6]
MNGQLGTVGESPDGLFALVCGAAAVTKKLELGKAYTLHSFDELAALGVTAENNPRLYKHVQDFYTEAEEGTKLVIYPVDKAKTFTELCDKDTGVIKELIMAENGTLRGIFVAGDGREATVTTNGLDNDLFTALPKAQQLAEWATVSLYAPLFIILEGRGYKGGVVKDLHKETYNRVGVLIGDTVKASEGAAVGLMAGRLATLPVQRNIARVKNGALKPIAMFLGEKPVEENASAVSDLYDAGYITPRKYVGKAGYFFTDDRLACEQTDDYAHITARRTIDKAYRIAYTALLDLMMDELAVNDDGTLRHGIIMAWQQMMENAVNRAMTAAGELSADENGAGCKAYIDPKQNVLSTSKIELVLKVRPFGYARYVDVKLGFQVENK